DVVNKDLGLSESDDEVNTHVIGPPISPIGSASPSSGSSSPSEDSESESSSAESTPPAPAPTTAAPAPAPAAAAPAPTQRSSWSLSNFAPPPAHPPDQTYDSGKDVRHALADIKGKPKWIKLALLKSSLRYGLLCFENSIRDVPFEERERVWYQFLKLKAVMWQAVGAMHGSIGSSFYEVTRKKIINVSDPICGYFFHDCVFLWLLQSPISEMSDSEASSPSPDIRRRRSRVSAASSDEDTPRHTTSPRVKVTESSAPTGAVKRGRPPKARASEERPLKKPRGRGRPRKSKQGSPGAAPVLPAPPAPAPLHDSDVEPDPPPHHHPLQDTKTHIFRKVFTPKKSDECGGKGGKGGKGKGGKGKGQVTIIEVTAPDADERDEERRAGEALARLSPPAHDARRDLDRPPSDRTMDRIPDRTSYERIPSDRIVNDRIPTERTSNDRIPDRSVDRISTERTPTDRAPSDRSSSASERLSVDRLSGGLSSDRLADRRSSERVPSEKMSIDRLPTDRTAHDRLSGERAHDRISAEKLSHDRLSDTKARLGDSKLGLERLDSKLLDTKLLDSKLLDKSLERVERPQAERYVRAEADVGSGLKAGRPDDRLDDATSNGRSRPRLMVRVSLSRLRPDTLRAIQRPARRVPVKRPHSPLPEQPALAESVSPLSPTPSPAGSVGSVGSGSASSGYCSLAHSVPAHAHQALLLLNKYYAFLYVAHDLWEQADSLCRLRANRDLFIAVDRKCGPLSLSSTFRHLVQYVRHAISLLKVAPRD
ncbi:hypothetical protein HF086_010937, partial [Spodoptera exigua]